MSSSYGTFVGGDLDRTYDFPVFVGAALVLLAGMLGLNAHTALFLTSAAPLLIGP